MLEDTDSLQLLTVVAARHHQGVGQTLHDRALSLAETLRSVTASSVGDIHRLTDLDVVGKRDVRNLNTVIGPFVEELDLASVLKDAGGQLCEGLDVGHNDKVD